MPVVPRSQTIEGVMSQWIYSDTAIAYDVMAIALPKYTEEF
ncbi:hypothetical protein CKA32_000176 [Geitlerinema sp. FC II]|nr:hypothetical protein [Baaleninema simplex]MDC0833215.1 hypothetical protein [Geitlerinema sp. CS-897]PPT09961.1 hypothetical protein CKA32_000176 [Geitlerinema sp. FC II]